MPAGARLRADDYMSKVIKLIPTEIVVAFMFISGVIGSVASGPRPLVYWIVFGVLLIITPFYVWRVTADPQMPLARAHMLISTASFGVWVFALGGPFANLGWYAPVYGSILLPIYVLVVPVVYPR